MKLQHIDHIYCLNLTNRPERWKDMEAKFRYFKLDVQHWSALSGSLFTNYWKLIKDCSTFTNPNYIGCAISHLSMLKDALNRGFKHVLILEDDIGIHRNLEQFQIPEEYDLLYFGWIPLTDNLQMWDYNIVGTRNAEGIVPAKNMWGLYGYAISEKLMKHLLEVYNQEMKTTLDEYLVQHVQNNAQWKTYAFDPQIVCTYDGFSDNSLIQEQGLLQKSVDSRYVKPWDYV